MTDFTKLPPEDLARVTTRVGRKVEIITTKGREPQPIVGYIGNDPDVVNWRANGHFYRDFQECAVDLILPPAPRVYYATAYPEPEGALFWHASPSAARGKRHHSWLALYKITDDGVSDTLPCEVIERNKGA